MAVLSGPLPPQVIARLKGVLDYYVWKGLPVVRKWPNKPRMPRTAASTISAANFGDNANALSSLPTSLRLDAIQLAAPTVWTWRDLWTAAIYANLYNPQPLPVGPPLTDVLPHISGHWYTAAQTDQAYTTTSLATGTIRAILIPIPSLGVYTSISWEVTATTGGNDRVAIYGPIETTPQDAPLVYDSGNVAIGSTGVKTVSPILSLPPGYYLLALQSSVTRTYRTLPVAGQLPQFGQAAAGNVRLEGNVTLVQAFGAFPATLGAGALFPTNITAPGIWLLKA